ncbi:MAG: response regulator [Beijerinckiaceae bacterium]
MKGSISPGLRVLVVEDECAIAAFLEAILADMGCLVVGPAATLEQALELGRNRAIDAAFLDIKLGGEHSTLVGDALEERKIPFVLMTGYDGPIDGYRPAVVLKKPFGAQGLEDALASCLNA